MFEGLQDREIFSNGTVPRNGEVSYLGEIGLNGEFEILQREIDDHKNGNQNKEQEEKLETIGYQIATFKRNIIHDGLLSQFLINFLDDFLNLGFRSRIGKRLNF